MNVKKEPGSVSTIHIFDAESGKEISKFTIDDFIVWLAISPVGRILGVATNSVNGVHHIGLHDVDSSEVLWSVTCHYRCPARPAFHPSGSLLAIPGADSDILIWGSS